MAVNGEVSAFGYALALGYAHDTSLYKFVKRRIGKTYVEFCKENDN